ncbi:MAG TPA: YaiO family outer membrane beta-barrel protein [Chitinophagaceae bacterium]|nr:YaiO family outer membrane beta-barrel protein [Chitinophagaceae bacterium]
MHLKKHLRASILIPGLIYSSLLFAQDNISSDELFRQARSAAFDQKNYNLAIELSRKALNKSPNYSDIRIFLGRIYTWSHKLDSARTEFNEVLRRNPDNEDAAMAYSDLEYWNDNPSKSLSICDSALKYHPQSKDLLLKKTKSLIALKKFQEANLVISLLLKKYPKNDAIRAISANIKNQASKNKLGVTYDFVYFDNQFNDPWHLASISYARSTSIGTVIGRLNYANRFTTGAVQFEADAYPRISKIFYSYINAGISNKTGVFPQYRAGYSLYANLPKSYEAEAGFRFLYFGGPTWIYTGSVGKYFKNYWFNFRTYLTPANSNISRSYSFTTRYYFGGADDYLSLSLGTGISPDNVSNNVQLNNTYKLKSNGVSGGYNKTIKKLNIISVTAAWTHQEYLPNTFGNQLDFGIVYQRKF